MMTQLQQAMAPPHYPLQVGQYTSALVWAHCRPPRIVQPASLLMCASRGSHVAYRTSGRLLRARCPDARACWRTRYGGGSGGGGGTPRRRRQNRPELLGSEGRATPPSPLQNRTRTLRLLTLLTLLLLTLRLLTS